MRAYTFLAAVTVVTAKAQAVVYTSENIAPPNVTGAGGWTDALAKARATVKNMTLDEKATMLTGVSGGPCTGNIAPIERIGFPGLCMSDSPIGISIADFASVFPEGVTLAASWDVDLARTRGSYLGAEFRAKGVNIALGPMVGPVGRNPLDGRVLSSTGPDPYLSGVLAGATIEGMQDAGTQACVKHYILNEQETQRTASTENGTTIQAVSSNVDDRTMHELYLWPFADSVKAGVASVMCSYNRVNGTYACENSKTLNGLLKQELGFQGYVMSDWTATMSGVPSMLGGLDMNMPGPLSGPGSIASNPITSPSLYGGNITKAVQNGTVPEWRLDDMVLRVLTPWYYLGQHLDTYPTMDPSDNVSNAGFGGANTASSNVTWRTGGPSNRDVRGDHSILIRELAASAVTLLKNTNGVLPYTSPPRSIAIFGADAGDPLGGPDSSSDTSNSGIGTYTGGSTGRQSYLITPLDAFKQWAYPARSLLRWQLDDANIIKNPSLPTYPPTDACFVFINAQSGEGADRTSLNFDRNGSALVQAVASVCNNTIVVSHSVGPNIYDFADNNNVTAILAAHLPATESGSSLIDVISGKVNPSGKLPYTIPYNSEDSNFAPIANFTGTTNPDAWVSNFTEGLFIDYRHFDKYNVTPRWEFGYGLSYTTFEIDSIAVTTKSKPTARPPSTTAISPGGNSALYETVAKVTLLVRNTGSVTGATVAQIYIGFPDSAPSGTPLRVLRGFRKIKLNPGGIQQVEIPLSRKSLSYWDINVQDWIIPVGEFKIYAGISSRDIRQTTNLTLL